MPKRTRRKSSSRPTRKTSTAPDNATSDISESELDAINNLDENEEAPIEAPVVESLVAGRQKRSTAGNRLATLLDKEANKDDDLELLFAEAEDDVEFEVQDEEGGLSDVQLESSDEDEAEGGEGGGEGGPEGQEDLSGERELQAEVRAEKAKKRKAPETFFKPPRNTAVPKKKVTIVEADSESTTITVNGQLTPSEAALNKHRKKSERISWIPTEGPTRSSSRKLSVKNREVTHHRLKESEARRLHTIALMEAAAKKKEKQNPKREMTQAERLEEAKKTEAMNKKSLNKWEQSEATRQEQQRLKLAALHNRNLSGAVTRWWSGQAEWDEKGRLIRVGKKLIEEVQEPREKDKEKNKGGRPRGKNKKNIQEPEPEKKTSGQTTEDEIEGKSKDSSSATTPAAVPQPQKPPPHQEPFPPQLEAEPPVNRQMPSISDLTTDAQPKQPTLPPTFGTNPNAPLLDGILYYASLPDDPSKRLNRSAPLPAPQLAPPPPPPPPPPPKPEYSTRNLVILQNFEDSQVQTRETLTKTLFPNHAIRREKPQQEICYVTSEIARFRDPQTGIPYANLWAYKQIQRIRSGQVRWSSLLEAYVGPVDQAAKGVPEGFL